MRIALVVLLLSACASSGEPADGEHGVVIAKLELRDVVVLIESGDDGPRYALTDREGRVLARDLDAAGLAAHHPDAAEALETGRAGSFLDARIDPPAWTSPDPSDPALER